ncbi:MAG: VWA domain-containing protein, partial [Deltaproteobacteria bacterium]|nr:VWA domain-containing protein [Deltaproteobacteria bacterium]
MRFSALVLAMSVLVATPRAQAADLCGEIPDAMILLDRSGSMMYNTIGDRTLWDISKDVIATTTAQFHDQIGFGLMLFPRWEASGSPCTPDTHCCLTGIVNVPVSTSSSSAINTVIGSAYPHPGLNVASTPSSASLSKAGAELDRVKKAGKSQYIIFITDGKETCSPNHPSVATSAVYKAYGIKTFVVGFGSRVDAYQLEQAASQGGTGSYYQADNMAELNTALEAIAGNISCCGNNMPDADEMCDPCPTACDDNDASTTDKLLGSGCNAYCEFTPIPVVPCGNGQLDSGERCDTAIPAGEAGACPKTPGDCWDDNPCTSDQIYGTECDAICTHMNTCPIEECGDGVLQSTEKCDTSIATGNAGACPQVAADCDDGNATTKDYVVGADCMAECQHSATVAPPECGNGKVEAGEWCDTAIQANEVGACPTSCGDNNECTTDTLLGSDCLTYCANAPITKAIHSDGCCPPGATAATDNDCGTACGNGFLEAGEDCDPGITTGSPGACPAGCPSDGDPCTTQILGGSACNPQCITQSVAADPSTLDGCCPVGLTKKQDADCLPPCTPDSTDNCINP